jgi:hypothetical protein
MWREFGLIGALALGTAGCAQLGHSNNDFVFLGESNITGEEAAQEANVIVRNANAAGCHGVSVGGYATTRTDPFQIVYGVPVMVSCPAGVVLLPNGSAQP